MGEERSRCHLGLQGLIWVDVAAMTDISPVEERGSGVKEEGMLRSSSAMLVGVDLTAGKTQVFARPRTIISRKEH